MRYKTDVAKTECGVIYGLQPGSMHMGMFYTVV